MSDVLMLIKAAACAGIFWRFYTYHWPKEAKYRVLITATAYLVMFIVGCQTIAIVIGASRLVPYFDAAFYFAVLILVMTSKGNIANILRVDFNWSGVERRKGLGRHQ